MIPGKTTGWFSNLSRNEQFITALGFQTTVGSLSGGVTAELSGGSFLQGMGQGAWTAAFGFVFSEGWEYAVEEVLGQYRGQEAGVYRNDPLIYSERENRGWAFYATYGNDLSFPSLAGGQAAESSSWIGVWGQGSTPSSWQVQEWEPVGQVTDLEADPKIRGKMPAIMQNLRKKCGGLVRR